MRYKNDNDNRYRVRFMRSTEELMDILTVKGFISYLEENAELEDETHEYIDGKVVKCKAYDLKEAESNLHKEFLVTEDGRVFYWLSLLQKVELVDREDNKEEVQDMQEQDFRSVKDVAKGVIDSVNAKDTNWRWRVEVLKSEIRVWWGYLQYIDTKDSHFTIKMGTTEEGNTNNDFITARDEHNNFITGAIIGSESYCDGDLAKCVTKMIRALESVAHRCY